MLKWTVTALLATSSFAMLVDQKQTDTALLQEGDLYRSNAQIKQDSKPPEPKPPFELEWDEPHLKWYWWNTDTHEPTWRDPADTATMHCCTKSPDVGKKSRFICRKDGTTAHNPDNVKSICPSISEKTGQTAMRKTHSKHGDYMCKEETGAEGGVTECDAFPGHNPKKCDYPCAEALAAKECKGKTKEDECLTLQWKDMDDDDQMKAEHHGTVFAMAPIPDRKTKLCKWIGEECIGNEEAHLATTQCELHTKLEDGTVDKDGHRLRMTKTDSCLKDYRCVWKKGGILSSAKCLPGERDDEAHEDEAHENYLRTHDALQNNMDRHDALKKKQRSAMHGNGNKW